VEQNSLAAQLKLVTSHEESVGFALIRTILRQNVYVNRISGINTQGYFGVILDDNSTRPICRLYLNAKQKYIGIFNGPSLETRHPIERIDEIFRHSDALMNAVAFYE